MFEDEQWTHIEEPLSHYLISTHGRVKHIERPDKALKPIISDKGFPVVTLYGRDGRSRYLRQLNVLVARAFLDPPYYSNETSVWHLDGNFGNIHYSNLKWETRSRVLEWNEMHRRGRPTLATPRVKNNRTGVVYENAYECAMAEGLLESGVVWRVTRQGRNEYDENARYRFLHPHE